jgi:hypothetical protein
MIYGEINHWPGWKPNPVFQLYVACTSALDNFSADSFYGSNAPRFVMLKYFTVDHRNMFLDTPATWNAVLLNYSVLQNDLHKALLTRKSGDAIPSFEHIGASSSHFGELIKVPDSKDYVYARLILEPTLMGRLWSILYRGAVPDIVLTFQDGAEKRYRIVPETLSTPFLISEVPNNLAEMLDLELPKHAVPFHVVSLRFVNGASPFFYYPNRIEIEWLRPARR